MKHILFVILSIVSISLYSQDTTNVQITETERIIDKYGEKIINGFNKTIESVTPYAEEGFKIIVKLQIVKGIGLLLPLFFAIIFWILFKMEYNRIDKKLISYKPLDGNNPTIWLAISLLIACVLTIIAMVTTYDGILLVFVPEWYAIKEIMNLF